MSPVWSRALQLFELAVIQAVILFVSAGTLCWAAGWWYIGLYVFLLVIGAGVLIRDRTDVIAERSKGAAGSKGWDRWVTSLMIMPTVGILALAGLDARWDWTPSLPLWLRLVGGLAFAAGYAVVLWAMYANPYFAQVVRIQTERGHVAVSGGPYRIVRHPGYFGMTLSMLGAVFLLDSLWGLTAFALYAALIAVRTALEDKTLRAELPGYVEFSAHTKYRLIPGVW